MEPKLLRLLQQQEQNLLKIWMYLEVKQQKKGVLLRVP